MRNDNLPKFVLDQAYQMVSKSITIATAAQYRSALRMLETASVWLGNAIEVPFT